MHQTSMPLITDAVRKQLILQRVQSLDAKHERVLVPTRSDPNGILCPVISMPIEELYLNPFSHRIKTQLEDDPEWKSVSADPFSSAAQEIVAKYVKDSRSLEEFADLKSSLNEEGQTEAGVITNSGILINGNTRAVALSELVGANKKVIRVAVLEPDVSEKDIILIEGRLQLRKEHKVPYKLSNQLRLVEDLEESGLSKLDIAKELRLDSSDAKKAEAMIQKKLGMLEFLREASRIPDPPIGLSHFDRSETEVTEESLGAAFAKYQSIQETGDLEAAYDFQLNWVLCVLAGVTTVHQLRSVDQSFLPYALEVMRQDEVLGAHVDSLQPRVTSLDDPDSSSGLARGLIDNLTARGSKVELGQRFKMEKSLFREALNRSLSLAVQDKRDDDRLAGSQRKPLALLEKAQDSIAKCEKLLREDGHRLSQAQMQRFEYLRKRITKDLKNLDKVFEKKSNLPRGT